MRERRNDRKNLKRKRIKKDEQEKKKENKRIHKNNKREGKLTEKEKGYSKHINWWPPDDREDCTHWEWSTPHGPVPAV